VPGPDDDHVKLVCQSERHNAFPECSIISQL
jgi:hypothetical protein